MRDDGSVTTYSLDGQPKTGECRINAPEARDGYARWPVTSEDDFCGKFEACVWREAKPSDFTPVARLPDGVCKKCGGKGSRRAGFFSKRFKPCECVL